VDSAGNLYIADSGNQRIRKVTPRETITTVAGNGTMSYSGDGGPAARASLSWPYGVAVDSSGSLFLTDSGNNRVRKVTPDGMIRTVAGNGKPGYSGDNGPARNAQFNGPDGIALDTAGNLYIVDAENQRIRKVTPRGVISTIAGDGARGYSGDGGLARSAQLNRPSGVAVDPGGSLYIADSGNDRVRKVTPRGIVSTMAGNGMLGYSGDDGPATSAQLLLPRGVAVDSAGNLYIADGNKRVRKVARGGAISTVAGNGQFEFSGDGGPATRARLSGPWSVALDSAGTLYFSDYFYGHIRKVAPDGRISTVAGNGERAYGCEGNGGPATSAPVSPWGLAVDSADNLYFADRACGIRKVTRGGMISVAADHKGNGVALDSRGGLFISDDNRVMKITPDGAISTVAGSGTAGYSGDGDLAASAQLNQPWGIAVDAEGNLYIADSLNDRIRKVDRNGIISTVAGNGKFGNVGIGGAGPAASAQLNGPAGVAVDSAGNLFIADSNYHLIRKVARDGSISTVAGNGTFGYSGDGGPATEAQFNDPIAMAVGADGKIYVADYRNDCIRVLTPVRVAGGLP
jgi:sugar lactone lactonase YvrE